MCVPSGEEEEFVIAGVSILEHTGCTREVCGDSTLHERVERWKM